MTHFKLIKCALCIAVISFPPQLAAANPSKVPAHASKIHGEVNRAFGLTRSEYVRLDMLKGKARPQQIEIMLDGMPARLELEPFSNRARNKFKVWVQQHDGSLKTVEPPAITTYRGKVTNQPESLVAATVTDEGLEARILYPDGDELWVTPVGKHIPRGGFQDHIVYRMSDLDHDASYCDHDHHIPSIGAALEGSENVNSDAPVASAADSPSAIRVAEIAFDSDFSYFQKFGSLDATITRIENIVNGVNVAYERDLQITHEITTIIVRPDPQSDPYSSDTDAGTVLNEFRDYWLANYPTSSVPRDVAQLLTGKNTVLNGNSSVIGLAWIGGLCNSYSFGIAEHHKHAVILSAHELGHNWTAQHVSSGDYIMRGSIQSSNTSFDPVQTVPTILSHRDGLNCLTIQANEAPAAPSNLNTVSNLHSEVQLTWNDHSDIESTFQIHRSLDGVNWSVLQVVPANTVNYTDTTVDPLTTYYYRVNAVNEVGPSDFSNVSMITTPDVVVINDVPIASFEVSSRTVDVGEIIILDASGSTDSDGLITSYDWNFGDGFVGNGEQVEHAYNSAGQYSVSLSVVDNDGARSATVRTTITVAATENPNGVPNAPSALIANKLGRNRGIELSWLDNSNIETKYEVQRAQRVGKGRSASIGPWAKVGEVNADITRFLDRPESGRFKYRVRAVNLNGASAFSNETGLVKY